MEDYIYRYKGNDYKYLGIGKFKNDFDGAWIDAVLYEREGHKYMREVKDFFKKFEDVVLHYIAITKLCHLMRPL